MRVSSALREAGMFDIGEHLTKLTTRQIAAMTTPIGSHVNGHQITVGATCEQFYKADGNITIKTKKILVN